MKYQYAFACAALTAAVAACTSVIPDSADKSKPVVALKVKNADGQYVPMASMSYPAGSSTPIVIMCTVDDPGGVSKISLTFTSAVDSCTVGSQFTNGTFFVSTPPAQSETVQKDAQGQVPTKRFFMATASGPFKCTVPGTGTNSGPGLPIGTTIKAFCSGSNWSNNANNKSDTKTLAINLQ